MNVLMIVLYILLFLVFLSILIIIHELGHLAAAKAFNVYCLEYSIGMGPLLFKHKRKNGETQFSLRAIPFGGYVAMYGEGVELPEGVTVDQSRSLNGIKAWKRAIILLAGVTMNAVLALGFFFVRNCIDKSLYINCLTVTNQSLTEEEIPDGLIFKYELQSFYDEQNKVNVGVYLVDKEATINGDDSVKYAAVFNYNSMTSVNNRDLADYLCLYPMNGEETDYDHIVDPRTVTYANIHFTSNYKNTDPVVYNIKVNQSDGNYQSFGCSICYDRTNTNFGQIVKGTFTDFGDSSVMLFKAIGSLFTSKEAWADVGGVVAVAFETTSVLQKYGFDKFLYYWGFISVNLAIFNLLPFPGLDGWQLLVTIIESATRKKIPEKVKNIVSLIGLALLLTLMVVVVFKDVFKYILLGMLFL